MLFFNKINKQEFHKRLWSPEISRWWRSRAGRAIHGSGHAGAMAAHTIPRTATACWLRQPRAGKTCGRDGRWFTAWPNPQVGSAQHVPCSTVLKEPHKMSMLPPHVDGSSQATYQGKTKHRNELVSAWHGLICDLPKQDTSSWGGPSAYLIKGVIIPHGTRMHISRSRPL